MVLEIIIIKYSCILKTRSRNTNPEPQPADSASFGEKMQSCSALCIWNNIHSLPFLIYSLNTCLRRNYLNLNFENGLF